MVNRSVSFGTTITGFFGDFFAVFVLLVEKAVFVNIPTFETTIKLAIMVVGFYLFLSIGVEGDVLTFKFPAGVGGAELLGA